MEQNEASNFLMESAESKKKQLSELHTKFIQALWNNPPSDDDEESWPEHKLGPDSWKNELKDLPMEAGLYLVHSERQRRCQVLLNLYESYQDSYQSGEVPHEC